MRLLHTSDLHLGRSLGQYSLLEAQRGFLDRIVEVAIEREVDAVLVAGDVYDRAVPPAESVVMFEQFLVALRNAGIAVVVISGNHDSPQRLGYGSALFREGLHVLARPQDVHIPVVMADEHGEVLVYGIPFLEPEVARRVLAEDQPLEATHQAVVGEAMRRIRADLESRSGAPRVVVLSHAFVVGGAPSESERVLTVGTLPTVSADTYEGAHYVALGHLHGPQQPRSGGGSVLRYSGSPLRYSISERDHLKSVVIVDLDAAGSVGVELVELEQPRPMADLRGTLDELLSDAHVQHVNSWVRLTVTDQQRPDSMYAQLRARFPHEFKIEHQPEGRPDRIAVLAVNQESDPIDVAGQFAEAVRGSSLTDEERELLATAYRLVLAEEDA